MPVKSTIKLIDAPLRIDLAGGWSDVAPYINDDRGAVLNFAIDKYVSLRCDEDTISWAGSSRWAGLGLGASGAYFVCLAKWLYPMVADKKEIAILAQKLETLSGNSAGYQDEFAAALGGIRGYRFSGGEIDMLDFTGPEERAFLSEHILLCSVNHGHASYDIHADVFSHYTENRPIIRDIAECAEAAALALVRRDDTGLAAAVSRNWALEKRLSAKVSTPLIDKLSAIAMGAGAMAIKACGAGGGGCIAIVCGDKAPVIKALLNEATIMAFDIDMQGVQATETEKEEEYKWQQQR